MQTFLPYPDFALSARVLDRQRLGKQRVETYQLLRTLMGRSTGWGNHPAARMWAGHEWALATYGLYVCSEWRFRGYDQGVTEGRLREMWLQLRRFRRPMPRPGWMGDPAFHESHRLSLVWKDPDHYFPLFEDIEWIPAVQPEVLWPI